MREGVVVVFTPAGTYLVYDDEEFTETNGVGLVQWRWKDATQNQFEYTWTWDDWEEPGTVLLQELTQERLIVIESFPGVDEKEITVLRPHSN